MQKQWPPMTDEERKSLGARIRVARAPLKTAKEVEGLLWVMAKHHTKYGTPPETIPEYLRWMRHLAWWVIKKQNWWTVLAVLASLAIWAYLLFGLIHVERAWGDLVLPTQKVTPLTRTAVIPYSEDFNNQFEKKLEEIRNDLVGRGCTRIRVAAEMMERAVSLVVTCE